MSEQKCPHKTHRVPNIPGNAALFLPECAGREKWLKARTLGVGGSEIAALIGCSEYMTAFDVYRNKTEAVKELTGIPAIEWGHRLEDVVAVKTADELGLVSRTGGGLWRHNKYPWAVVTPDRFATRRRSWKIEGLIECKTAGEDEGWTEGSAPLGYRAQLQWQMGILGLRKGWLGCLVLSQSRNFYVVEETFDKEWYHEMLRAARDFWRDNVKPEEPPMHDLKHPRTDDLLKELHPKVVRESVELPEDALEWREEYHRKKAAVSKAEKDFEEVKNWVRMHLTDAGAGYVGEEKVASYPEINQERVNIGKLKEMYPEAAQACTEVSTYRRLTVTKPKKV